MRKKTVLALCLLFAIITIVGCNNKTDIDPNKKLTYPEATKLADEIGEKWIELNEKENKTEDERKLFDSISLIGVYENNVVIVTLTDDDEETIRLFRELILKGLDNADTVQFDKGERPVPVDNE